MKKTLVPSCIVFLVLTVFSLNAFAQSRLKSVASRTRPASSGASSQREILKITKFYAVGSRAVVETPIFNTSAPRGINPAKLWHKVEVVYETARTDEEWINDLTFRYFVLARKSSKADGLSFTLYQKNVHYVDIEVGPRPIDHRSTVFLRPSLIKKNGPIMAVAVEIVHGGEVVARASELANGASLPKSDKGEWWKNPVITESPKTKVNRDDLLDRANSPWALINIDDYEVIK